MILIGKILKIIAGKSIINPSGNISQSHIDISNLYLTVFDS